MLKKINFFNQGGLSLSKVGLKFLYIGVFLLPSAPVIAGFTLFISLLFSNNNNPINFFRERKNNVFIIVSLLMILSCIYNSFINPIFNQKETGNLSWISLINWIPFFWCFWGFQPYLEKQKVRRMVGKLLVIGSIPVIISGFLQYFFNVTGPFQILNGLIIWYQKPIILTDGLTGPFNNANYAGSWLTLVWPFSLYYFLINTKKSKRLITAIICSLLIISILLTNSRNSWLGMLISIQIMLGFETIFFLIPLILLSFIILTFLISVLPTSIRNDFVSFIPINIFNNFPDSSIELSEAYPRLEIWRFTIENILKRPLLGWGGGSFPIVYETLKGKWIGHPHNIIFEIAFNYGVITAVILSSRISLYLYKYYKLIANYAVLKINSIKNNLIFEKAWFSSILFITYSHLFDMQYFDLRISIMSWILLAGIRAAMI
ncbi:MAG: O-antigen ligase family protein [Prochlorococcus marinus CUG1439]|uniref:O-antigen ligase family protein n=1 Tax=Prochlorococcus sp. MIT 1314 TaxID=3096220 RepID=UPI001B19CF33|nr:O-antigen ligase family protein [Prochlorococcus sp. MIT 1314]MCR8538751.1 O-antigen ligase family protein [Prochlorococcus marinus CUG1439]